MHIFLVSILLVSSGCAVYDKHGFAKDGTHASGGRLAPLKWELRGEDGETLMMCDRTLRCSLTKQVLKRLTCEPKMRKAMQAWNEVGPKAYLDQSEGVQYIVENEKQLEAKKLWEEAIATCVN